MNNLAKNIRDQLATVLEGRLGHITFTKAAEGFPPDLRVARVENLDHTAWELVYHMHAAQRDILEFIRNPDYTSPDFPSGYWPKNEGDPTEERWYEIIDAFHEDMETLKRMVQDPGEDLYTPFPHGTGQNLFREVLTLGNHNSYHIGQFVDLRMLLEVPVKDW
ncbi:MAG: DinB family protein [Spirochaetia bacterium]